MPTRASPRPPTTLAILGAAGRMGQAVIRAAARAPAWRLVAAVEAPRCSLLGKDAGQVAGIAEIGVTLTDDARQAARQAEVLVEFSFPSATARHAALAAALRKPLVIGTTGLSKAEAAAVRRAAVRTAIVWAPNMSVGVNLLFAVVARAAAVLPDYDLEIIETHHRHKHDAPSGTALRLAEAAAEARGLDLDAVAVHGRRGLAGDRPAAQIGIHAVRAGDVVGDHTVLLAADGERLELTHRASTRDCFARGALRAAAWLRGRRPGLYRMLDVLDLKG